MKTWHVYLVCFCVCCIGICFVYMSLVIGQHEGRFKYNQPVSVVGGFYEGCSGIVISRSGSSYVVEIDGFLTNVSRRFLEPYKQRIVSAEIDGTLLIDESGNTRSIPLKNVKFTVNE